MMKGDVVEIEPTCVCSRFGKIVLPGGKIKGSALVHRWTPHKTHRPHTILLPLNSDFWEGKMLRNALGTIIYRFDMAIAITAPGGAISGPQW